MYAGEYKIAYEPYQLTGNIKGIFLEKENQMSLAKKYVNKNRNKLERRAIEEGLIREDGTLTGEGKDLLLQILLDDKEIKDKFFQAINELTKDKEV